MPHGHSDGSGLEGIYNRVYKLSAAFRSACYLFGLDVRLQHAPRNAFCSSCPSRPTHTNPWALHGRGRTLHSRRSGGWEGPGLLGEASFGAQARPRPLDSECS